MFFLENKFLGFFLEKDLVLKFDIYQFNYNVLLGKRLDVGDFSQIYFCQLFLDVGLENYDSYFF